MRSLWWWWKASIYGKDSVSLNDFFFENTRELWYSSSAPGMSTSSVDTAPSPGWSLLIHLPVNVVGRAGEDGPRAWAPVSCGGRVTSSCLQICLMDLPGHLESKDGDLVLYNSDLINTFLKRSFTSYMPSYTCNKIIFFLKI